MSTTPTTPETLLGGGAYPPTYELVRHIVSFLRWRFSKLPAGAYRYDPADEEPDAIPTSEVFIGADTPIDPVKVGQRPAVTVLRSSASFNGLGINDQAYLDLRTGARMKMDLIPTNLMVNVLSALPVEAERIAWFVAEQIWIYREEIVEKMPALLYTGQRPTISAPSPAGSLVQSSDVEWSVVVVSFPAFLQHSTIATPLNAPVLKGIKASAETAAKVAQAEQRSTLQGTAVGQKTLSPQAVAELQGDRGDLPQSGGEEAQSAKPLTVQITTQKE